MPFVAASQPLERIAMNVHRLGARTIGVPESRKTMPFVVCILLSFLSFAAAANGQNQRSIPIQNSDLARQNMNQVAASAGQIKEVLLKDAGLMVELKQWVAKDATDHGQIISESDLTNDSLFDRLENDVQLRSVATRMLQRYGYLVPKVNPDSELGKQQELLVQERVKWITQEEEEARQQQHAQAQQKIEQARLCAQGQQSSCVGQQRRSQPTSAPEDESSPNAPPLRSNPSGPNPPALPQGQNDLVQRAQLMQTGEESGGDVSGYPFDEGSFGDSYGAAQSMGMSSGLGGQLTPSLLQQLQNGENGDTGSGEGGAGLGLQRSLLNSSMGGMGMGAMDLGGSLDQNDLSSLDMGQANATGMNSSATRGNSSQAFTQPFSGQRRNRELLEPVEMVRAANPYKDIPSLYDMYMQAVPRPAVPRRFGIDVFQNQTQGSRYLPMDLPAGPDYVVGPGDSLTIDLWGGISRRFVRTVDREGRLSLPEVGPVLVSGKSLTEVQENVQQVLRSQYKDVSADISLSRLRTIRVYEVGDIENPGAYDISSLSTPLNALFSAGGPTSRGSLRIVKHYRGNQLVEDVDLYDLLLHGVKGDMQRLENGDTILVPPIGPQVTVDGMVRRPAIYELKDEKDLARVLELAGGLLPTAALRHIEVQRLVAHEKQTMLSLDIPNTDDDAQVTQELKAFEIHDGDQVRVFPIAQGNEDAVYLEGHVIRPGRYSYRADMRVTDMISSFKELLPEPATEYAEIIRLNAPDFHPTVESFNLSEALENPSQAPTLHPMDTVRIFSRFDFENPPTVSVLGDVRRPGTYQTSGQIHLADAIHLAGGLAPDAQTSDAQVFRHLPDGTSKIFGVSLSQALEGNTTENIVLEPRDRLLIHGNSEAVEPPTVYIHGEVEKPGRYPLTTNMTVADLIRVGGGMKLSADTQAGDLTRYEYTKESNSDQTKLTGQHESVAISAVLSGDSHSNVPVHNGDVLTIRQLPGWNDLGASISLRGEVKHPGTYGIRPGERLSSVLERAGGFQPDAYPYGAVLERVQVRELEGKQQDDLILRVKDAESSLQLLPDTTPQQKQAKEAALAQYQTTLLHLDANPPLGRVSIRISSEMKHWKNAAADVEVRAGDTLIIPKRPSYVMITGQVFNPTAVSYRPGRSAKWYLSQSGGPTTTANKKGIFVIRADGSVVGEKEGLWSGSALGTVLQPGDTIVVPEKVIGGGIQWANLFQAASIASSIASTVFIAVRY